MKNNPVHGGTIKQYLTIAAILPHCLDGPILSQLSVKIWSCVL